ncbi:hypothetical protein [Curtobacterium sp. MCBD17_040]|uniref:hypothetical protein n=1 Tax=Curtobacterium sp. MCBD17_040 TaxID=2175674 RepID=UPI000DA7446A|nr:hypothetical protein [Curtobacterium sp. MCBD17_040]WIB64713.1 hypothetical protein DEI94_05855 [Curtobacterium sp. MCBD17_040]
MGAWDLVERGRPRGRDGLWSDRAPGRLTIPRPGAATLVVLGGYAVSRVLATGLLLTAWIVSGGVHDAHATLRAPGGFGGFLTAWDGAWYRRIALHGYPSDLPVTGGAVQKSVWAFLPAYPAVVRALMSMTSLGYAPAAVTVSVVAGGAATVVLHRLLAERFGSRPAMWGALFFAFGPLGFLFQVAYAESLFLALVFAALLAVLRGRPLVAMPFGVAAAFTHPGALAVPVALAAVWVASLVRRRPLPLRTHLAVVASGLVTAAAGLAWPVVVTLVTGRGDGYVATETAWWRDYIGDAAAVFRPLTPWFLFAERLVGGWGVPIVALLLVAVGWCLAFRSRALGVGIGAFVVAYVAYLVAVFLPQQSTFRMLLPLSPVLGTPALSASPRRATATLVVGIAVQPIAIWTLWVAWPP